MNAHPSARYVLPVLVLTIALLVAGVGVVRGDATEPPVAGQATEVLSRALPSPASDGLAVVTDDEEDPEPAGEQAATPDGTTSPQPAPEPPADVAPAVADTFPEHAAARQVPGQPETFYWAVIVGPDAYRGATGNTIGSAADARVLTRALHARGWRGDHVLTLTDGEATGANIRRALQWLAQKTDQRSTAVFSFSGHMDHQGSGPGTNTALWAHDNERIWSTELGQLLGAVQADRTWITFQGCHAAGLAAPGVEGDDRVVTYSSHPGEKSYEDPQAGMSVMGNYLFREGIAQGWGNGGNPAGVSVQGAFEWAAPRANTRTAGKQTPVMSDRLGEPFTLEVVPVADRG